MPTTRLAAIMFTAMMQIDPSEILYEFIYIAERYGVNKQEDLQRSWAEKGIAWMNRQGESETLNAYYRGCIYYFADQHEKALDALLATYRGSQETRRDLLSRLGCTYAKLGKEEKAYEIIRQLQSLYERTSIGWALAFQAHIYAQLGELEKAVDLFLQAKEAGIAYVAGTHDQDIMLVPI